MQVLRHVRGMAAPFQLGNDLVRHEQIAKREFTVREVQAASHVRPWSPELVHHWDVGCPQQSYWIPAYPWYS